MAETTERIENGFRQWLPLWLFLAAQTSAGIWWAATMNAKIDTALSRANEVDVLGLQFQKLDKEFAVFRATTQKGGGHISDNP